MQVKREMLSADFRLFAKVFTDSVGAGRGCRSAHVIICEIGWKEISKSGDYVDSYIS
jgi:hypothetical protein